MAQKSRIHLKSNFPAVKRGAYEAVQSARDQALDVGEHTAETAIDRVNDRTGYNLPADIEQEKTGFQSGLIRHPDWFMKFFEYGTVYISPGPFMRPAHRKMRAKFIEVMDDDFEGWIRRKGGSVR